MSHVEAMCPRYQHAVELIGARWSGAIVRALLDGRSRCVDIKAVIPGLSDTMLAQRLRELEGNGIVERSVPSTSPIRVEYRLTAKGRALAPVVDALVEWAERWIPVAHPVRAPRAAGSGARGGSARAAR